MYKRILVAVDGSEHSKRAAEHAAYIGAFNPEATIVVIYVSDYERARILIDKPHIDQDKIDQDKKLTPIKRILEDKSVNYELIVDRGDPGPTIVTLANESNFDLVIIGSRGLNSFQEMVLGSVSHKVAKSANMPVLIVK